MKRSVPTVIIEPRALLREGLVSLLHGSNFKVIATIATPDRLPQLPPGRTGLVIIGLSTGSGEHLDCLEKFPPSKRQYKIVVVAEASCQAGKPDVSQILSSRVDGYVLNVHSRDVLLKSLELTVLEQKLVVLGDNSRLPNNVEASTRPAISIDAPAPVIGIARLSDRELEILSCLACGGSNKIIGRTCRIAESTVKIHLKSILRKIQVRNRTQAAIWAIQNGLGTPPDPSTAAATNAPSQDEPDLYVAEDQI